MMQGYVDVEFSRSKFICMEIMKRCMEWADGKRVIRNTTQYCNNPRGRSISPTVLDDSSSQYNSLSEDLDSGSLAANIIPMTALKRRIRVAFFLS
jgi:hypothetical protein